MNTETTRLDRLRVVIGVILVVAGVFIITVLGAVFAYSNTVVWIVGLGLIITGLFISKSTIIINLLNELSIR